MTSIRMPKTPPPEIAEMLADDLTPRWISQSTEDRDSMHLGRLYPSSNAYGIPDLPCATVDMIPENMIAYRDRPRSSVIDLTNWAVHFYLDDYRFGGTWSKPWRTLDALNAKYRMLLTPDFSLYWHTPYPMKLWNVYRNRWVGAFWADQSRMSVIPSVSWAGPDSYPYAFLGIPQGSVVAMRGIGSQPEGMVWERWRPGYEAMLAAIQPEMVLVYGRMPFQLMDSANIREYDTRWQQIKQQARRDRSKKKALSALSRGDR